MKKYRVTQPFIAFGKTPEVGEIVELTTEQAESIREMELIAPYSVKVERPVKEIKSKKKPSQSVRPGRRLPKKTARKSKKAAKK